MAYAQYSQSFLRGNCPVLRNLKFIFMYMFSGGYVLYAQIRHLK